MENLWGIFTTVAYTEGKKYNTIHDLEVTVKTPWKNIPIDQLQTLSISMPNRINEVILYRGGYTKY